MKTIFYVVNVDWFFVSHRLPLAIHAKQEGYDVFLLTHNTGKKEEIENLGIHFIEIPFERSGRNPLHEIICIYHLIKCIRLYKPDIIHNVTLKASILSSFAAKFSRCFHVVNAISGLGYNFTENRNGIFQKVLKTVLTVALKSRCFYFILQNPDDIRIMKRLNLTSDSHYCLIKGSGVDLNSFAYSQPPQHKYIKILFPARILFDKGIIELISAAKTLESDYKEKILFTLAGSCDDDNLASLSESELKKYLIPGYLEWVGFQNDMITIYQDCDIVVLPSYREGLPKSLIEACAIGRPIVTTDVPGCRECVIDKTNGFLVPAKDSDSIASALKKLIDDKDLRLSFGKQSRIIAEKEFSIETVLEKTFSIYDSVMNNK